MLPPLQSLKSGKSNRSISIVIPGPLAGRIARLADVEQCSFDDILVHLVEKGFEGIQQKLEEFSDSGGIADLSTRQRAVLEDLRKGLAVKEIADNLKVSEVTVRTHILRIRERLGCADILKLRIP